jgi:hypothetical protein
MNTRESRVLFISVSALIVTGCANAPDDITEVQSAVRFDNESIATPAFYNNDSGSDADYTKIMNFNPYGNAFIIVNIGCDYSGARTQPGNLGSPCLVAGGPGPLNDSFFGPKISYLASKIGQLHDAGVFVFGYVYTGGIPLSAPTQYRNTSDIDADINRWAQYGAGQAARLKVDGIFFDASYRSTTSGVAAAEYLSDRAQSSFQFGAWLSFGSLGPGRSIFNWGDVPASMQTYVNCLTRRGHTDPNDQSHWNYLVLHEKAESDYLNSVAATPVSWLQNTTSPYHFITIVHHAATSGSTVPTILSKSRDWNSFFAYVTDSPVPPSNSRYATTPGQNVWSQLMSAMNAPCCKTYQYGVSTISAETNALNASCVAANPATPSYP